ncbi:MAG: sulfatase-like hydrolase/transferase, partial [Deltaproteobacteria bacterium]|nr:sulfatase-like hydrolase/transferase [Deltaproteobacteria bacterium]
MKKSFFALSLLIIAGIGVLWYFSAPHASKPGPEPAPPAPLAAEAETGLKCRGCNLIMISLSNVSAERMSLYGYSRPTTPKLDEWAKDALVFEDSFTQSSWTLPVGTTLFTSLYPYAHKVMNRFHENILDPKIRTLPEILR